MVIFVSIIFVIYLRLFAFQTSTGKDSAAKPDKREIPLVEGQPAQDGEASSFLRQKKDELNQKRQDRLGLKEKEASAVVPIDKANAAGDATLAVSVSPSVAELGPTSIASVIESITSNSITGPSQLPKKTEAISTNENVALPSSLAIQKIKQVTDDAGEKVRVSAAATASASDMSQTPTARATEALPTGQPSIVTGRALPQLSQPVSGSNIPLFYFPMGQPMDLGGNEGLLQRVKEEFDKVEGGKVTKVQMGSIVKVFFQQFIF